MRLKRPMKFHINRFSNGISKRVYSRVYSVMKMTSESILIANYLEVILKIKLHITITLPKAPK